MSGRFPPSASGLGALVVVGALVVGAGVGVAPRFRTETVGVAANGTTGQPGSHLSGNNPALKQAPNAQNQPTTNNHGQPLAQNPSGYKCASGQNGGNTDTGVSGDVIKLASTVAQSGIGASFLGDAHYGMVAAVNQVNRSGGICGRQLKLTLVDDGWSPDTGQTDIRNFIHEGYFALAVVPSSEGLNSAAAHGDIDNAGIPVVGSDGMLKSQYADPWIWPVAASTISTMHIAAKEMYDAGVRTFGLVYDSDYKFGSEGAVAFKAAIGRLPGASLKSSVGIPSGQQSYGGDAQRFEDGCHPCDGTFMLLEPDTAISWIQSDSSSGHYVFGAKQTDGPQPLFTSSFGRGCGSLCNNMWLWSGYQAPYPPFADTPADQAYVNAIHSVSSSADVANQFLEGSYIGMNLLIQAMQKVGPDLTRSRLRQTLDSMTYNSGLTQPETWRPGNHYANTSMLGFSIQYSGGFNGFQYQNTGWLADPWVTQDR